MAVTSGKGFKRGFQPLAAGLSHGELSQSAVEVGVRVQKGKRVSDSFGDDRISVQWPHDATGNLQHLALCGADRQFDPGGGLRTPIGVQQGGTALHHGSSSSTCQLQSIVQRITLLCAERRSADAIVVRLGSAGRVALISLALFLGMSVQESAGTDLDERGQPDVLPRIGLIWDPLPPCGWRLSLQNTTSLGQLVSLRATDGTDGYRVRPPLPLLLFVPERGKAFAADFACTGDTAPTDFKGVTWYQSWAAPPGQGEHDAAAVYRLPFAPGRVVWVGQDINGTVTHHNERERAYAIDFDAPEVTPIHAARDGVVLLAEERFHLGGFGDREYFSNRANHVVIRHRDGMLAQYGHLKHQGVTVAVGQSVRAGDLIGFAGSTGLSDGPHLHFAVSRPLIDGKPQSFALRFRVHESRNPVQLSEGDRYTATGVEASLTSSFAHGTETGSGTQ